MDNDARKDTLMTGQAKENIEIYLVATNLACKFVSVTATLEQGGEPPKPLLVIKNTKVTHSKANFINTIKIQYLFQARQTITVDFYSLSGQVKQYLGNIVVTVGKIFRGKNLGIIEEIKAKDNKKVGQLWLKCQKIESFGNKLLIFDLVTHNLDIGYKCLYLFKQRAKWQLFKYKDQQEIILYESQYTTQQNYQFNQLQIQTNKLCNRNPQQPIILRFLREGQELIAEQRFTLAKLLQQGNPHLTLMHKGSEKGMVEFQNLRLLGMHDFIDYMDEGMQIAMVLCIDFTASNRISNDPLSLHYHTQDKQSQYQIAFKEVCKIVLEYDYDKSVPTFGFGAKVQMPNFSSKGNVHHCFPLNGLQANPNLFQLQGIMRQYRNCLPFLQLSGPTYFAPLLKEAMVKCNEMKSEPKQYMILLILTDGNIHDLEEVQDLLVDCGRLPLSVIIIGIGEGEEKEGWSLMEKLDDDQCLMKNSKGKQTQRDLVQFVPFSKFANDGVELAKEVLKELPNQVVKYHQLCGLSPQIYKHNLLPDNQFSQIVRRLKL